MTIDTVRCTTKSNTGNTWSWTKANYYRFREVGGTDFFYIEFYH